MPMAKLTMGRPFFHPDATGDASLDLVLLLDVRCLEVGAFWMSEHLDIQAEKVLQLIVAS